MSELIQYPGWPAGLPRSLDYPEVPVHCLLKSSAATYGDQEALVYREAGWSFAKLWELAGRLAAGLKKLGIAKGDVVGVCMTNVPQYLVAYYGTLLAGATYTPLSPMLSAKELEHQANTAGAKAVVVYQPFVDNILPLRQVSAVHTVIATSDAQCADMMAPDQPRDGCLDFGRLLAENAPDFSEPALEPRKDLAHIAFTGGTTGLSKGVAVSHFNVTVNTLQTAHWRAGGRPSLQNGLLKFIERDPDQKNSPMIYSTQPGADTMVNVAPWFHALGIVVAVNSSMYMGHRLVTHTRLNLEEYIADIARYRASMIAGVPTLFYELAHLPSLKDYNLSGVRLLRFGAAPLDPELWRRLGQLFPGAAVSAAYGLTESTTIATSNPTTNTGVIKVGSAGLPIFDTDVKIIDPESGQDLPTGQNGEVCLRGPQVTLGYLNQPEETAQVYLADGWLRTGDLGHLDPDGYLFLVGRRKEMLIYKGYNVFPVELESVLYQHPAVKLCAVVGLPDPTAGEIPKAFVCLREGARASEKELMDFVNEKVSPYKKIRQLEFLEQMPLTPAGKILKRKLVETA
ncbi:MAG: AMP-binding protein [Thermodesulfobacteriota bacterium]